jgi:hypothetical protein
VGRQAAAQAAAVGIVTALATVGIFTVIVSVIVIVLGLKDKKLYHSQFCGYATIWCKSGSADLYL